ncbi:hypothetical protein SISNIDRAFT_393183, partial [Sistotremastrum niveocremeum HHB9708]
IDDGCSIITIREDLWREMETPSLHVKSRMSMEGADTTVSHTKGKLRNLPLQIGTITFYIQAQVVPSSPVPLLLGMPFFALSRCNKEIEFGGDMTITLTNPN